MDFGLVGFHGLVGSSSSSSSSGFGSAVSDPLTKQNLYGSGWFRERGRPVNDENRHDDEDEGSLKGSKRMAKTFCDNLSNSDNGKPLRSSYSPLLFPAVDSHHQENQMLTFSSPRSTAQSATLLPYFQLSSVSPSSTRDAGCNTSNNGTYSGFTASQWIELEHQTTIYKYISANIPIPSTLLFPIRKAFESAGLSCLSGGLLRSNTLGSGGFHMRFSSRDDPEPGRCRRTDGKKWRCSKDAVPDQKYCERHMNRGRHRSRKPVEGQVQGHSSSASVMATITTAKASASKDTSALLAHHQPQHSSRSASTNGVFMGKNITCNDQQQEASSFANLKPKDSYFLSKHENPFEKISHSEFGFVQSECGESSHLVYLSDPTTEIPSHHQLLQFMENLPRNPSQRNQLSGSSGFSSSTFRNRDKTSAALSPLRLSCEADPTPMGLGVEGGSRRNISLPWESPVGGPLGEALQNSSQSSPTGVLQKTTFVS
ncbi:PREDICTED: growth-regulating factor 1-like [Tarenaya hassleriana]|uniref:growth-regulating factor 1-like n=1 Tax=Tarenaya hassleriana TaxID=28532 RepID=UPI00053C8DDC|nr:PREDICTED: growth-regulating factor 1-like [Tarenaya hassleriana]